MQKFKFWLIFLSFSFYGSAQTSLCFTVAPSSPINIMGPSLYILPEDFNGDGIPDLVASYIGGSAIQVFIGNGNGSFAGPATYYGFNDAHEIISKDFNGDGKKDLAVSNYQANNIRVLYGTGAGTFTNLVNFYANGGPQGLTSNDFNGDGFLDLAVANSQAGNIQILQGDGLGNFTTIGSYNALSFPVSVISEDFNGDGAKDLVITKQSSNNIAIMLGTGTGSFMAQTNFSCSAGPRGLCYGDFNNDGKRDVATSNYNSNSMSVFLGTGTGSFFPATTYSTGQYPGGVCTADFNNDGNLDLATSYGSNIAVFTGDGTGSFTSSTGYTVGNGPNVLRAADFNNDGRIDLATPHTYFYGIYVHLNAPTPTLNIAGSNSLCTGSSVTLTATGATSYSWSTGSFSSSIVESPTLTSVYSLTGAIANGCHSYSSITVSVIPNNLSLTGDSIICSGNSASLAASGAVSYTWSNGSLTPSIVVTPSATTVYSVSGINACGSYSNVFTVSVNPSPTLNVAASPTVICSGQISSLTVSGAGTYTWMPGGNNPSVQVNPSVTTVYSVSGTAVNNCTATAVITVSVNSLPTLTIGGTYSICSGGPASLSVSGANAYLWSNGSTNTLISVSPSITTIYSVSGTDINNCTGNSSDTLFVNPSPVISVNSGSICSGNTFIIVPSGAFTYTVTGNSFTVTPPANTSYSVAGSSSLGCAGQNTAICNVTVNPLPSLTITSTNSLLCVGESATLTAIGANTYTWNGLYTGSTLTISPVSTMTYSVGGSDQNGCIDTALITQNVDPCLGLKKYDKESKFLKVYPNPSHGIFYIDSDGSYLLDIFDVQGRRISGHQLVPGLNSINTTDNYLGLYFIKISSPNGEFIQKMTLLAE